MRYVSNAVTSFTLMIVQNLQPTHQFVHMRIIGDSL
jgi:hypothetical protein